MSVEQLAQLPAPATVSTARGPLSSQKTSKTATPTFILSHWCKLIENLEASPLDFYTKVEAALAARQVPQLEISRVDWKEGGALSPNREYLRLSRQRLIFDVCAAPFGKGFFVSWWFGEMRLYNIWAVILTVIASLAAFGILYHFAGLCGAIGLSFLCLLALLSVFHAAAGGAIKDLDDTLLKIPLIGAMYERFFRKWTYYRVDLMLMYQQAVHAAVLEVIDEYTEAKGIAPLSELERKPALAAHYDRQG